MDSQMVESCLSRISDAATKIEVLEISDEQSTPSTPLHPKHCECRCSTQIPMKPTGMDNVMKIVSNLPTVGEIEEFCIEAASYLVTSESARELVVSGYIKPDFKVKWLQFQLQKLKNQV